MATAALGALQSTTTAATTAQQASKTAVDYDAFLNLLGAQMKNQDPTNPMDSTEYVAQLASFSQVEQSVQINTRLESLLQASTLSQADALIGRTVTSADGNVSGVVTGVKLISGGAVALLDNGKELTVGAGLKITAK
jgi:flagellar basal-body rod modification protein FlgD